MKAKTFFWLFMLLLPTQFLGQGPYYGKIYDQGGAVYNVLANSFGYTLYCDDSHDDATAFQNLVNSVSAAGGGIIQFSPTNHYCLISSAQLIMPPNIHLRGCGPGAHGPGIDPVPQPACGLDLRYTGGPKMIWNVTGSPYGGPGSIVDMAIVDHNTSGDCNPLMVVGDLSMWIERNLFQGTQSGSSACNDAILMGSSSYPFGGYKGHVINNFFDKIQRAVLEQTNANGVEVSGNIVQSTCGNASGGAFEASASTVNVYGGTFAYNDIEMKYYKYGIYLGQNAFGFHLYGNTCSDAHDSGGLAVSCYAYDSNAANNFGVLGFYQDYWEKGVVDTSTDTTSTNNQTLDPWSRHNSNFSHVVYNQCWGHSDANDVSAFCENGPTPFSIPSLPGSTITMVTPQYYTRYRFSFTASQTSTGTCAGPAPTLSVVLYYTDGDSNQSMQSPVVGVQSNTFTGVVASWTIPAASMTDASAFRSFPIEFNDRGGHSVGFKANYVTTGCTTFPTYAFYPHLEQLP